MADLKKENRDLLNRLVESQAIIESMLSALEGEEVSDFMASFPEVRRCMDFRMEMYERCEDLTAKELATIAKRFITKCRKLGVETAYTEAVLEYLIRKKLTGSLIR